MRKDPFAKKNIKQLLYPAEELGFAGWTGNGERSIFAVLSIAGQSRTTPVPWVTNQGTISGPGRYDAGHRSVKHTYDCRHWRAGRPLRYDTTENTRISRKSILNETCSLFGGRITFVLLIVAALGAMLATIDSNIFHNRL